MNARHSLTIGLVLFLFFSCTKNAENPVDSTPLQLIKKTTRQRENGLLTTDSVSYQYDAAGHLIAIYNLNTNLAAQKFNYSDETLTAIITFDNSGFPVDTAVNPVSYADNGSTALIDFTRPGTSSGTDTIKLTYKWSGDMLLEAWTYLHFTGSGFQSFQKTILSYDAVGNEIQNDAIDKAGNSQWQSKGLTYDQHKNFFKTTSRLNYIFMGWGFPYATRSNNNPTRGQTPLDDEPIDYIWTYNSQGYPLTMKRVGSDYVSVELQYNK